MLPIPAAAAAAAPILAEPARPACSLRERPRRLDRLPARALPPIPTARRLRTRARIPASRPELAPAVPPRRALLPEMPLPAPRKAELRLAASRRPRPRQGPRVRRAVPPAIRATLSQLLPAIRAARIHPAAPPRRAIPPPPATTLLPVEPRALTRALPALVRPVRKTTLLRLATTPRRPRIRPPVICRKPRPRCPYSGFWASARWLPASLRAVASNPGNAVSTACSGREGCLVRNPVAQQDAPGVAARAAFSL